MSTYSAVANQIAYTSTTSSSWTWNIAYQGAWGKNRPYVGAILFSGLRSSVAWGDMDITAVRLWLKFGSGGASRSKTLGIYAASRSSIGGLGADMPAYGIGLVNTATNAWNTSETITFNATTNADAFAQFKAWLERGSTNALALFMNESASSSNTYSTNYLNIENAGIEIDYEMRGSTGYVEPAVAETGTSVTLQITPTSSSQSLTHTAQWSLGSASSSVVNIAEGVTQSNYTIPASWLNQLSGVTSAEGTCTLSTYEGGTLRGSREIPFTVKMPDRYTPVLNSFSVRRYASTVNDSGQTVYVESLSGNKVWVSLSATIDRDGGSNPGTAQVRYYPAENESAAQTVNVTWNANQLTLSNNRSLISKTIPVSSAYVFELTISNGHSVIRSTVRVEKSWAPLHVAGTGYGVGVGMYSEGTQENPMLQVAWPASMAGGINGVTNYCIEEVATGGHWIDGKPIYRQILTVNANAANTWTIQTGPALENADNVISFDLVMRLANNCSYNSAFFYSTSMFFMSYIEKAGSVHNAVFWTNHNNFLGTYYYIVYYTKTTD